MTRIALGLAALLAWSATAGRGRPRGSVVSGMTPGVVSLKQEGAVNGSFGRPQVPRIKGTVKGRELKFEYDEGQVMGDATFTLDPSRQRLHRHLPSAAAVAASERPRPDPLAADGKAADFAGLWLTDLGLMELTQDGTKVRGRYAVRGRRASKGRRPPPGVPLQGVPRRPRLVRPRHKAPRGCVGP